MKLLLTSLFIVLAVSQVRLAAQTPAPEGVLIGTSDEFGVRIADRPAIVIDTDKVVVPSLYHWGATEIRLTHGETVLRATHIYELPGRFVSIVTFEPPIPMDEVQTIATEFEHGVWLRRESNNPDAKTDVRIRTLHLNHQTLSIGYAVTPDVAAAAGSAFYDTDGALVGILGVPAAWQPFYPASMSLCSGQDVAAYVAWLNEQESGKGETWASWRQRSSPSVSEFSRLFLDQDARPDELQRIAARWNERDPDWTKSLPQELYFMLFTVVGNNNIVPLQHQLIQEPPEFLGSGADRFRMMKVGTRLQQSPGAEDVAELHAITVEGGPMTFVACVWMAEILSQAHQPPERVSEYLKKAANEYAYDPILYEISVRVLAEHAEHDHDDGVQDQYTKMSERWQLLDWSVAASLTPATQLLEWALYEQAAKFAATGVERWPDDIDLREALVRALVGIDDIEAARGHLAVLKRLDPQRAAALVESNPSLGNP